MRQLWGEVMVIYFWYSNNKKYDVCQIQQQHLLPQIMPVLLWTIHIHKKHNVFSLELLYSEEMVPEKLSDSSVKTTSLHQLSFSSEIPI